MKNGNALDGEILARPTIKTSGPLRIDGIGEMAQKFPDENWYTMTLRVRKIPGGAEVQVNPRWERVQ